MFESTVMRKQESGKPNLTGIPNATKARFENASGLSFDDVRIHYNSDKPALIQAHAYTQGNQVYIGPGQERHLGHELGHVVQQKEGRVRPTTQLYGGMNVNDDVGLEKEADVIGGKAAKIASQCVMSEGIIQKRALVLERAITPLRYMAPIAPNHHHIWFEQENNLNEQVQDARDRIGINNVGFTTDGLFDDEEKRGRYSPSPIYTMEDENMAIDAINDNNPPGNYNLLTNNCQHWARRVVERYRQIVPNQDTQETGFFANIGRRLTLNYR